MNDWKVGQMNDQANEEKGDLMLFQVTASAQLKSTIIIDGINNGNRLYGIQPRITSCVFIQIIISWPASPNYEW